MQTILRIVFILMFLTGTRLAAQVNQKDAKQFLKLAEDVLAGKYQQVIDDLQPLLNRNPDEAAGYMLRGHAKVGLGQNQAALVDYNQAIKLNPYEQGAYLGQARAYRHVGKYQLALEAINTCFELMDAADQSKTFFHPEKYAVLKEGALIFFDQKAYPQLRTTAQAMLALYPDDLAATMLCAEAFRGLEEYQQAITHYDLVLKQQPQNILALRQRGYAKTQLGDYAAAEKDLLAALAIDPEFMEARFTLAEVYLYDGKHAQCLKELDKIQKVDPNALDAIKLRANVYRDLGDAEGEFRTLNDAVERYPAHLTLRGSRAFVAYFLGDTLTAQEDVERLFKFGWRSDDAYRAHGLMSTNRGKFKEGLVDYDTLVARDPTSIMALNNRAFCLYNLQKYEAALMDLNRVLELKPDYYAAIGFRGTIYHAQGRHEEALAEFAKVLAIVPDRHITIFERSKTYEFLGQYDKALADCAAALKLDPDNAEYQAAITRIQAKQNEK